MEYITDMAFGVGNPIPQAKKEVPGGVMHEDDRIMVYHKDYMIVIIPSENEWSIIEYGG